MFKALEIAVVLSAVDRMTQVFNSVVAASSGKLKELQDQFNKGFNTGKLLIAGGTAVAMSLAPAISAFAELEDSSVRLQSVMLRDGGVLSENYKQINDIAVFLGNKLPGTTADFQNMFNVLIRGGITETSILNGVGKAAAYLAIGLQLPYEEAARLTGKLKEATGIADSEMLQFMDTIARVNQLGVDTREMQYAFSRSAGALKLLNIQGLDASKSIASVYAQLIKMGASGETVGTGMTSVLNSMFDANKMGKFNTVLNSLGMHMDFVDRKTGEFKGIEHMIAQFNRLKQFNPQERANLVRALLGPGQDASFMNTLINNGIQGFNTMQKRMAEQATLNAKVDSQLSTLKNVWEAATGTFTNALASFGSALAPELKALTKFFMGLTEVIREFSENHPKLMKFIGLFIAIAGALMVVVGVFFILKAAFIALTAVMMANPIVLIIAAIVALAVLIYVYWEEIVGFFKWVWGKIKEYFAEAWKYIQYLPMFYIPTLIIKYWDKIAGFFSELWARVKQIFWVHVMFILRLPIIFFNAGMNIVKSLWNGIKSMANKPIEAIKEITKKMRDYLPFSPAKEGAFRDLHRVRIMETIAQTIKPAPVIRAMANATRSMAGIVSGGGVGSIGGGSVSNGFSLNYSPVINFAGPVDEGTKDSFSQMLGQHKDDIMRMIDDIVNRRNATRF